MSLGKIKSAKGPWSIELALLKYRSLCSGKRGFHFVFVLFLCFVFIFYFELASLKGMKSLQAFDIRYKNRNVQCSVFSALYKCMTWICHTLMRSSRGS